MRRTLGWVLAGLAAAAVSLACAAAAATAPKTVLLVFSHERERYVYDPLESRLRAEIDPSAASSLNVYTEYLDAMRFEDETIRQSTVEYFGAKYRARPIDAIVAVSPLALDFVLDHREELFPRVPIVFASVNQARARDLAAVPSLTGVAVVREVTSTLDLALRLHPDTQTVFVPAGTSAQERAWTNDTRRSLEPYRDRVAVEFLTNLGINDLEAKLAHLPSHSLVLSAGLMYYDANGHYFLPEEILRRICRSANAPVYSIGEPELGLGIVGGSLYDMGPVGAAAGAMVRRVLAGDSVDRIPVQVLNPNYNMFDARQLQRWGIDERRLPADAIVRFREPSIWRDYRRWVLAVIALLTAQSLLIVSLLYQRRARHHAELESRRHLALAADANRRATVSALTGSLAHELHQPLGAILHNARAAERLVAANRAAPETLREILTDICTEDVRASEIIERHRAMLRSHAVERNPVDVRDVVRESLALVGHDMLARHVQVQVDMPPDPCIVSADQVLLRQVLVNLIANAMDAMAQTPPERRCVTLVSTMGDAAVEISVRDAGTGLRGVDGQLFEPFVTTKPNGLGIGLTISRNIVEAHRGRLEARNNPEGGATFCVTLPREATV